MASYVGIDLHRRRSVIVVLDETGERVSSCRIENSRMNLELATPRHRESDEKVRRGKITKQGPVLVRWAAIEAVTGRSTEPYLKSAKRQIGERRGPNIGKVAAARKLLTLVFYGLRDGEIRCLQEPHPAPVAV